MRIQDVPVQEKLEKFVEDVKNAIYPLTAYSGRLPPPPRPRAISPETAESVKSVTPEPFDIENRRVVNMMCNIKPKEKSCDLWVNNPFPPLPKNQTKNCSRWQFCCAWTTKWTVNWHVSCRKWTARFSSPRSSCISDSSTTATGKGCPHWSKTRYKATFIILRTLLYGLVNTCWIYGPLTLYLTVF